MTLRLLVCGGRDYGRLDPHKIMDRPKRIAEKKRLTFVLSNLVAEHGRPEVLIHGGAKGADALAADWAAIAGIARVVFPAEWENVTRPGAVVAVDKKGRSYDKLAGHFRNQRMINEGKPTLVVAFPGGTGTADMVKRARDAKIEVMEID